MAATAPAPVQTPIAPPTLKQTLGLWMATALVVGNTLRPGEGARAEPDRFAAIAGSELGPGRGGPRCRCCPTEREELS
jgi:hypothetical protein